MKAPTTYTTEEAQELKKRAELAFDQLHKANSKLKNDKIKPKIMATIERVTKRIKESRNRLVTKGMTIEDLGEENIEIENELRKEFATIEHKRLKAYNLKRKYEMREKDNKKKEKGYWEKVKKKELDFREQRKERIKEWQEFAKVSEKDKIHGFDYDKKSSVKEDLNKRREEERKTFKGYGVDEGYKNDWR